MAYLTAQMVQDFCGKFVEESDTIALDCARAAMETIEKYLGYNPESETKTVTVYGTGSNTLCVPGWITELTSIEGFEDVSGFETFKNYVQFKKPAEYFE
ncbi:MAG: hypothetical protein HUK20_03560, partial [Fibrobacter sp.]|nr:hypothetical protein [Fibrobacter sp.]